MHPKLYFLKLRSLKIQKNVILAAERNLHIFTENATIFVTDPEATILKKSVILELILQSIILPNRHFLIIRYEHLEGIFLVSIILNVMYFSQPQ